MLWCCIMKRGQTSLWILNKLSMMCICNFMLDYIFSIFFQMQFTNCKFTNLEKNCQRLKKRPLCYIFSFFYYLPGDWYPHLNKTLTFGINLVFLIWKWHHMKIYDHLSTYIDVYCYKKCPHCEISNVSQKCM
jgi:hypothetical protein